MTTKNSQKRLLGCVLFLTSATTELMFSLSEVQLGIASESVFAGPIFFSLKSRNRVEISLKFCLSMMYLIEVNNKIALLVLIVDFSLLPGGQLGTGR